MSRVATALTRIGDLVDTLAAAARRMPGRVRAALAVRTHRRIGMAVTLAVLPAYLLAIGDLNISVTGRYSRFPGTPSADLVSDWPDRLLAARAPYMFEPVAAVYPLPQLAFLVSPVNILIGGVLASLIGLNVALTAHAAAHRACRRTSHGRVLGALPAFLAGIACCVPTFLLVLGTSTAAVLAPVFIPLRGYFLPLSLTLLTGSLLWSARQPDPAPTLRPAHPAHDSNNVAAR